MRHTLLPVTVLAFSIGLIGCDGSSTAPADSPAPTTAPQAATTQPASPPEPDASAPAETADEQANSSAADLGAGARADDWHAPADRLAYDLDFHLTDQDDREVNLNDFVGKPMAVTFFFTRCPNPEMCPVIISRLAQLESRLDKAGLGDQVRLVAISYDPVHDAPAVMKAYGMQRGMRFDSSVMLRPNNDEYQALLRELEVNIVPQASGTIGHFIEMILIDKQGRYVRDYRGDIWSNDAVFADLQRLVAEPDAEAPTAESATPS